VQGNLKPVVCLNCWGASAADVNESKDPYKLYIASLITTRSAVSGKLWEHL